MCNATESRCIEISNRVLVGAVSSSAIFMNGFQPGDILVISSTTLWLTLPECSKCMERILDQFKSRFHSL